MAKKLQLRVWAAILVAGLAVIVVGFPSGKAKTPAGLPRGPRKVQLAPVEWSAGQRSFRAFGLTRPRDHAALSFTVPGRVKKRLVDVGDRVTQGDLLVQLDAKAYQHGARIASASAEQARAQLSLTQSEHSRISQLSTAQALSTAQLEGATTALAAAHAGREAARAQLREARRHVREADLRAPFAGVIVALPIQPGEYALPGQPVVVLSGDGELEVEVEVPGRIADRLRRDVDVTVRLALDGERELKARVASVASATSQSGLFPVRLVLTEQAAGVRPGAAVEVLLQTQEPRELTVPAAAVVAPSGVDASVFRVRDGVASAVPVGLGAMFGSRIGVRGDLEPGDQVVVTGYIGLVSGERVEALP